MKPVALVLHRFDEDLSPSAESHDRCIYHGIPLAAPHGRQLLSWAMRSRNVLSSPSMRCLSSTDLNSDRCGTAMLTRSTTKSDRKSTRLNSGHACAYRMPAYACNKKLLFL